MRNYSFRGWDAEINMLLRNIESATKEAVEDVCLDLQSKSQQLAPIDTGDLRASASTEIQKHGTLIVGRVGFNESYALKQHEELSYNHPRGGQAKYLETPLKDNEQKYINYISNKVKEVL